MDDKALERKFLVSLGSGVFRLYVKLHASVERWDISRDEKIRQWVETIDKDWKDGLLTGEERDEFITWDFKD